MENSYLENLMFRHVGDPNVIVMVDRKTMWHVESVCSPTMKDWADMGIQY